MHRRNPITSAPMRSHPTFIIIKLNTLLNFTSALVPIILLINISNWLDIFIILRIKQQHYWATM